MEMSAPNAYEIKEKHNITIAYSGTLIFSKYIPI
jgi:hypothetical protein